MIIPITSFFMCLGLHKATQSIYIILNIKTKLAAKGFIFSEKGYRFAY